jgi:hypothetical protein
MSITIIPKRNLAAKEGIPVALQTQNRGTTSPAPKKIDQATATAMATNGKAVKKFDEKGKPADQQQPAKAEEKKPVAKPAPAAKRAKKAKPTKATKKAKALLGRLRRRSRNQASSPRAALELADDFANGIIAKQIVELARAGERHPDVLCEGALKKLRGHLCGD